MDFGDMDEKATQELLRSVLGWLQSDDEHIDHDVDALLVETGQILNDLGDSGVRGKRAADLLRLLTPTEIDVSMWRKIAAGENIHLPASDQYGPNLRPRHEKVAAPPRGNVHGSVHSKGKQAPSDFMKRQGRAIANATRAIVDLEQELEQARERQAALRHGLKAYATTCLLTAVRQAAAPVFAMGPAWTLLSAIQSKSGKETFPGQDNLETSRILVILHALRERIDFQRELKSAMLQVCNRYEAAAKARNSDHEFGGLESYDKLLRELQWPERDADFKWRQGQPCERCAERDRIDALAEEASETDIAW